MAMTSILNHRRRRQRGVVSVEVALAFPALILIVGSVVSICRLTHINIRLDRVSSMALHDCVLKPDTTPDLTAECIQASIDEAGLDACTESETVVTFDEINRDTVDPETGEVFVTAVPVAQADITCMVSTFGERPRGRRASWVPDTELTSTVHSTRN